MNLVEQLVIDAAKSAVPGLVTAAEHAAAGALGIGAKKKSCVQSAIGGLITCMAGYGPGVDAGKVLAVVGDHIDQTVANLKATNTPPFVTDPGRGGGG